MIGPVIIILIFALLFCKRTLDQSINIERELRAEERKQLLEERHFWQEREKQLIDRVMVKMGMPPLYEKRPAAPKVPDENLKGFKTPRQLAIEKLKVQHNQKLRSKIVELANSPSEESMEAAAARMKAESSEVN